MEANKHEKRKVPFRKLAFCKVDKALLRFISFLTRELRMRNTSYRELWENVSLDRSIRCKLYANEVRTRLKSYY